MHRKARLFIKQLVEAVERMIEIQISEQIYENKQQKEKGEPPRQAHLTPRKLDELHLAGIEVGALVVKRRWKAPLIISAIDRYLEILGQVVKLYEEDHPDCKDGWIFVPRKRALDMDELDKWPKSRIKILQYVACLGRSLQMVLIDESGYGQSTVSESVTDLEAAGFIDQESIKPIVECENSTVRENEIRLTGAGKALCGELFGNQFESRCVLQLGSDERDHRLFSNIITALHGVRAKSRYYGETASKCKIDSTFGGGCSILPDSIVDVDHKDSTPGTNVPLEAEYASNITAFGKKIMRYQCSDIERVMVVCRDKKMARQYKDYLHKNRKTLTTNIFKQTKIEFFCLERPQRGYSLTRIGYVILG